jgi:predicted amidohydrolase
VLGFAGSESNNIDYGQEVRQALVTNLAAVVQLNSNDRLEENLARAERWVRLAVARGASLVALPENLSLMAPEERKLASAESWPLGPVGEDAGVVRRWASRLAVTTGATLVLGGVTERSDDPARVHNTCAVIEPTGDVRATYRKIHLFDVDLADGTRLCESRVVAAGDAVVACDTVIGRVGLSICYDVRFPELYRRLVEEGAEVLSVPAAFTVTTGRDHWHVLLRARAIESQAYVLAPAQWGQHGHGRSTYGHALIVDPWGTIVAECPDGEGIALAEIDLARVRSIRAQLPSLRHRRLGPRT